MFEKLIDVLTLLISAIQDNTAAQLRAGTVVKIDAPNAVEVTPSTQGTASNGQAAPPPKPPRRSASAKAETTTAAAVTDNSDVMPDFGGGAPAAKPLTKDEANEALVKEWKRLGGNPAATAKVNGLFAEYGVTGLLTLPEQHYNEFVAKVQALK